MKVAINGFGRIGRLVLRAFFEAKDKYNFEIVAINDLLNIDTAIHLLKHDSVHGLFPGTIVKKTDSEMEINGHRIAYVSHKTPEELPWKNFNVDLVLECTGIFKTKEMASKHLIAGAKKVIISCPADDADNTIVFGVNSESLNKEKDIIISNASCTTNCLAPIVKAIHESIGIISGFVTTVHAYTGDQRLVDMGHKDVRRSRSAALSMIPTSTGATKAIEKIFPELRGKLGGLSVRVPTPNVSMVDFTCSLKKSVTPKDVNDAIKYHADNKLKGILGYTEESLVSCDFNHDLHSSIADLKLTQVIDGNIAHIVAWYDNEWGFANRMLDVSALMF